MARNKVMKLWNAVVTAFLALCTALGLITTTASTTASAAVPQSDETRNSDSSTPNASAPTPTTPLWSWSLLRALPPTMKQRIHAEAHGKSPSCRHRPLSDTTTESDSSDCSDDTTSPREEPATGHIPLQR